jgi:hypothetical protein
MIDIPFDSIITLIVFLIGVPTIVFQSMPPDVRNIFVERNRLKGILFTLIFVPVVAAFVVSGVGIYAELKISQEPVDRAIRWVVVFSTMIAVILIVAIYFPLRYGRRQGVLSLLVRDARRSLKSVGKLPDDIVEDMIDLGKNAESPQEKSIVLQSIHELVMETCSHPSYKGDSLETLILKIHEIAIIDSRPVSLENFRMIAEIFQEIAVARKEIQHVADLQRTVKAVGGMGRAALMKFEFGLDVDNIVMNFIQTLGLITYIKPLDVINQQNCYVMTEVSEALFDIGSLAAKKQRDFIVVAALDKMITMLGQTAGTEDLPKYIIDELAADVAGLMAHVWAEGDVQKKLILLKLPDVSEYLRLPESEIFNRARVHYFEQSQFETANRLAQMSLEMVVQ